MLSSTNCEHLATLLRVIFDLLTVVTAFGWLRFADVRSGCLDKPSVHHQVWLRVLIVTSSLGMLGYMLSVALTCYALA